ncbi:methyl-CpG-binding domain protein 1-like isoform X3 [Hyla sarda]|nr:methyl-CpG-binding domain protein 1-like isoform X3 [Hyla sarda]XP_056397020.1 methyl-CpG-binding domain protein 1-like isoform X3 [Hyla sarda]XP_056397021.1 methyl-CpG-binding domain protein 1-like isoform X3 [Hyla sarda]
MSEGWEEWPILGPGWKRRTVIRKSGATSGQSDTYYQSPEGQRFRSRNELSKYLGDSVDLSWFDFKRGVVLAADKRRPLRNYMRSPKQPKSKTKTSAKSQKSSLPVEKKEKCPEEKVDPKKKLQNGKEPESSRVMCCSGCNSWFTGVEFGKSKQTVWYCADCRSSRRAYNKQQKLLKIRGCGSCTACRLTENCGHCSVCLLRTQNPEFGSSWKCVRRRCLQVIRKGGTCGRCPGCSKKEDCNTCSVCVSKRENPDQKTSDKCLKRWCHNKTQKIKPPPSKKLAKKLNIGGNCGHCLGCTTIENCAVCSLCVRKKQNPGRKIKGKCMKRRCHNKKKKIKVKSRIGMSQHLAGRRKNRKCGECEACRKNLDCGECDFCQDKPKFGGRNLKRQKCRWRQCLRFAVEKNIPLYLKSSNHPIIMERIKKAEEEEATDSIVVEIEEDEELPLPPKIPVIRLALKNGGYPSADVRTPRPHPGTRGGWVIGGVDTKGKQEMETTIIEDDDDEQPLDLHCPVKSEEYITEDNDIAMADESTPVIMEIFSLGSYNASTGLDRVLEEFMEELNEIPLPAHWEVLTPTGPNLHLVQRSRASTMAETIIHILPGLHFNIAVRNYTVPSCHELFSKHPSRLTTVDEVVELICDLEAYRPCAGLPKHGPRSPNCLVLVYEERCPECCIVPWPSGNYH